MNRLDMVSWVEFVERVRAMEERQRAYGMHDPDCPAFKSQLAQQNTGAHIIPQPCTCWLTQEIL